MGWTVLHRGSERGEKGGEGMREEAFAPPRRGLGPGSSLIAGTQAVQREVSGAPERLSSG